MSRRTGIWLLAALMMAAQVPCRGQSDKQTREIRERDRDYYERRQESGPGPDDARADELRLALIREADASIRDRNYSGKVSPHYRVQTDDPRLSAAASADLLEAFRDYFQGFWVDEIPLAPYEETSRVYLFYSYSKYNRLLTGKQRFDEFRTVGHYREFFDVVVVHTDSLPGGLADVLVHEAAHQLTAQQLLGTREGQVDPWVSEGLASYFGFTFQAPDGSFLLGVIGGKSVKLFPQGKRTQAGDSWQLVQEFRKGWKKGEPWPLGDFLAMDTGAFYGRSVQQNYTAGWMLVHYLLHGDGGVHRKGFVRYLKGTAPGPDGAGDLVAELGVSAEELARGFTAYVRELKPDLRRSR